MNHTAKRYVLPLLLALALVLAACGSDAPDATQPSGGTSAPQTEASTLPGEAATVPVYTEPEAPAMTFPQEPLTEPTQESGTETVPQEEVPEQTYTGGPSGDENELPAIPF